MRARTIGLMAGMRQIRDRFHSAYTCFVIPVVFVTPTEDGAAHSEAGVRAVHRSVHLGAPAVFPPRPPRNRRLRSAHRSRRSAFAPGWLRVSPVPDGTLCTPSRTGATRPTAWRSSPALGRRSATAPTRPSAPPHPIAPTLVSEDSLWCATEPRSGSPLDIRCRLGSRLTRLLLRPRRAIWPQCCFSVPPYAANAGQLAPPPDPCRGPPRCQSWPIRSLSRGTVPVARIARLGRPARDQQRPVRLGIAVGLLAGPLASPRSAQRHARAVQPKLAVGARANSGRPVLACCRRWPPRESWRRARPYKVD